MNDRDADGRVVDDRWHNPGYGSPFLFSHLTKDEFAHVDYAFALMFGEIPEETTFEEYEELKLLKRK